MSPGGDNSRKIEEHIKDGVVYSVVKNKIPLVLTGSIRDDGPLPYKNQDAMREHTRKATTLICLATQLHTKASNMTRRNGAIRPAYTYYVDITVNKLRDLGSLSLYNAEFFVHPKNNLAK